VRTHHVDVEALADAIGERTRSRRLSGSSDDTALLLIRFGGAGADQASARREPAAVDEHAADATPASA